MSAAKTRKAFPHERGIAWVVTFLLTVFLAVTVLGTLGVQVLTDAGMHLGVVTDGAVLDNQLNHIYENIDMLAEEYGFSAEAVKKIIDREELLRANTEIAAWWTHLLKEGDTGTIPRWYSAELEDAVVSSMDPETAETDPQTVVADLTEMIERTVFPLRETLLSTGMDLVNDRADIPGIIRSVTKLPLLGLVTTLAAAGALALLLGREIVRSLKHYGTALAAAGLSVLSAFIILLCLGPKAMVAEASGPLAGEVGSLIGKIGLEVGIAVVVLVGAGYACLILYRKKTCGKTTGESAE